MPARCSVYSARCRDKSTPEYWVVIVDQPRIIRPNEIIPAGTRLEVYADPRDVVEAVRAAAGKDVTVHHHPCDAFADDVTLEWLEIADEVTRQEMRDLADNAQASLFDHARDLRKHGELA